VESIKLGTTDLRSGNLWEASEPAREVLMLAPQAIEAAEVRKTRLPDWNDYFLLPLYNRYRIDSQSDIDVIVSTEGPAVAEGLEPGASLLLMKGLIGVHITNFAVVYTKEVILERFLFNMQNVGHEGHMYFVVKHPFEAVALMQLGYKNVVATMFETIKPAQEQLLLKWAQTSGVCLVGIDAPEQCLGILPKVIRVEGAIDYSKRIINDSAIKAALGGNAHGKVG